jgi:hypothetical protein
MCPGQIGSSQYQLSVGYQYLWQATGSGTTSSSVFPTFPLHDTTINDPSNGQDGFGPPIGLSVIDGSVTWVCVSARVFQIQNVTTDFSIIVSTHGQPSISLSGWNYYIAVGSGYFEEISSDNNTTLMENGYFNACAATGITLMSDFGATIINTQSSDHGVCAVACGYDGGTMLNTVIQHLYSEGQIVCDYFLSGVAGIT